MLGSMASQIDWRTPPGLRSRFAAAAARATQPQTASCKRLPQCDAVRSYPTLWPCQQLHNIYHSRNITCLANATPPPPPVQDFSPHMDTSVLGAQVLVLAVTLGAAAYWWWAVVPSARRALAKEKRSGLLNNYLVELQANPDKKLERWFYTDWLQQLQRRQRLAAQAAAKRTVKAQLSGIAETASAPETVSGAGGPAGAGPHSTAVTAAGAAVDDEAASAQQQDVEDKEPLFWSLDNPILATGALLTGVALISLLVHNLQ